jgi:hypothetical protein
MTLIVETTWAEQVSTEVQRVTLDLGGNQFEFPPEPASLSDKSRAYRVFLEAGAEVEL